MIAGLVASKLASWKSVLVAVSGGVDSMVLLAATLEAARQRSLVVEVAHVDHGLRPSSAAEANFVGNFAAERGVKFHSLTLQPPTGRGNLRVNLEEWGRRERYAFFSDVRKRRSLAVIATAHHANDAVETMLMRLISNKEPYGILAFDEARLCVRPLLTVGRRAIEQYAIDNQLEHVEDESNADVTRLRNQVRKSLLPALEQEFGAGVVELLAHRARLLHDDLEALNSIVEAQLLKIASLKVGSKNWESALQEIILHLPEQVRWRVCERWLRPLLKFNLGRVHGDRVVDFFLNKRRSIQLPAGWQLLRSEGSVKILRKQ